MPDDINDRPDPTRIHSGDHRVWGEITDLIIVKDLSIRLNDPELRSWTPGLKEGLDSDEFHRPVRSTINLDKIYVTQTYVDRTRPIPYNDATEWNQRSSDPAAQALNPSFVAAIGKLTDLFTVSVARNSPPTGDWPTDIDSYDEHYSFNDDFGRGYQAGIEGEDTNPNVIFGRFEIRADAHIYLNDRRSGPLHISQDQWPRNDYEDRADDLGFDRPFRDVELDYRFVESVINQIPDPAFDPGLPVHLVPAIDDPSEEVGMAGQVLTGKVIMNPRFHAWGIAVSIPRRGDCGFEDTSLVVATSPEIDGSTGIFLSADATVDDRVSAFSVPKCPAPLKDGITWKCAATLATAYLSCTDVSKLGMADRFIVLTDRINSLLNEIDRLYCITKYVDFNVEKIVDWIDIFKINLAAAADFDEFKASMLGVSFTGAKTCETGF